MSRIPVAATLLLSQAVLLYQTFSNIKVVLIRPYMKTVMKWATMTCFGPTPTTNGKILCTILSHGILQLLGVHERGTAQLLWLELHIPAS